MSDEERAEAHRVSNRKWYRAHKLQHNLKTHHNMSVGEYDTLMLMQNGRCAICKGHSKKGRLEVDHDHSIGKGAVRGLLCHSCNVDVAYVENNGIEPAKDIAAYLRAYSLLYEGVA